MRVDAVVRNHVQDAARISCTSLGNFVLRALKCAGLIHRRIQTEESRKLLWFFKCRKISDFSQYHHGRILPHTGDGLEQKNIFLNVRLSVDDFLHLLINGIHICKEKL